MNKQVGNNINNKIDINETGIGFINYFYSLLPNYQQLIIDEVIKDFTVINCNNIKYEKETLIQIIETLSHNIYNINNISVIDSGSRRLDILVSGMLNGTNYFSQFFAICNANNKWYLRHSIINIMI
jgi:hypothetical protein